MKETVTPLIQQYFQIKEQYPQEIVFFQVGDFYELFFEDAKSAASILNITLTKRGIYKGEHIPLCGIPVHMIENYYPKLLKQGLTVVICNQNEVAQPGKIVSRVVSEIITPSTALNHDSAENVYSLFIMFHEKTIATFWFEFGKQEILYHIFHNDQSGILTLMSVLQKYCPKEIITEDNSITITYDILHTKKSIKSCQLNSNEQEIKDFLDRYQLSCQLADLTNLFLSYIKKYFQTLMHKNYFLLKEITYEQNVFLDKATIKYLECVSNITDDTKQGSLYDVLDQTATRMGSRLLKNWILNPLKNKNDIMTRQNMIAACLHLSEKERNTLYDTIQACGDIERFLHRLRLKKIRNKELPFLKHFIASWKVFIAYYQKLSLQNIFSIDSTIIAHDLVSLINDTILSDTPLIIQQNEHYINPGQNNHLSHLYQTIFNHETILENIEKEERIATGIDELIIKKTPLYGYTFELSKAKDTKYIIPNYFKRIQTLSQKERYITEKLEKFTRESEKAYTLYCQTEEIVKETFIEKIMHELTAFFSIIEKIKYIDVSLSLAYVAYQQQWNRPTIINQGLPVDIIDGKHPVISSHKFNFVANSLSLHEQKKIVMITGPNMGGKSTYMRQNALIILLAHIGSYIPAQSAAIPIMEKILTRVGASDSVQEGKSTFYVELEELHTIITLSEKNSFVIIDEIGRGTSTYDGMALAASIIEHLASHNNPYILCATHYHELVNILKLNKISWCSMKAITTSGGISFLYRMIDGHASDSMGIMLAKQIGLPSSIIQTAQKYFIELKKNKLDTKDTVSQYPAQYVTDYQTRYQNIINDINELDINTQTPLQIQQYFYDLQKKYQDESSQKSIS